ncbi:MAG: DUF6371 domain-containing protein [Bacteroidales bacterium]|jgi:cbb3-type cytochrome oxidase cytochrome c subunit|nr:DUF6371 domain-containing protein [Bacteroidales bacterium]
MIRICSGKKSKGGEAMKEYREFHLQKYSGRSSRHTCPQCGKPFCFSLYVDEGGMPLSPEVGRCDHESSCGYHKTPKDYFAEHPNLASDWRTAPDWLRAERSGEKPKEKPLCTIPEEYLTRSVRPDIQSDFTAFLSTIFQKDAVDHLTQRYNLGVTHARDVIYFQRDIKGNIRTGKIMKYNPKTGKRVKDAKIPGKVNWIHSVLKHKGLLQSDWELTQCLFGEHLLADPDEKGKTAALVESEKTAVIASGIMPKYIWLATGGKSQLSPDRLSVLKGRKVIAFPDIDGYEEWKKKLSAMPQLDITVSDILEKNATEADRRAHIDIADWLIRWKQEGGSEEMETVPESDGLSKLGQSRQKSDEPGTELGQDSDEEIRELRFVKNYLSPESLPAIRLLVNDFGLIPYSVTKAGHL